MAALDRADEAATTTFQSRPPRIPSGDNSVWADVSPLLHAACQGPSLSLSLFLFHYSMLMLIAILSLYFSTSSITSAFLINFSLLQIFKTETLFMAIISTSLLPCLLWRYFPNLSTITYISVYAISLKLSCLSKQNLGL